MNACKLSTLLFAHSLLAIACTAGGDDETVSEGQASALSSVTYESADGCTVTVEPHLRQVLIMVTSGTQQASFGYRPDLSASDITAFCPDAQAKQDGDVVTIACDMQNEGSIPTRGKVTMGLRGPLSEVMTGSLESVEMLGERKGWFSWKTDTDFSCKNLRIRR